MTAPPGLIGSRELALALGIRGETTVRGPPGTRPKLDERGGGGREGERRKREEDRERGGDKERQGEGERE